MIYAAKILSSSGSTIVPFNYEKGQVLIHIVLFLFRLPEAHLQQKTKIDHTGWTCSST